MYKRLFVAIKVNPTETFLRRICLLKENMKSDNINWIPYEHYHVTLFFLGKTHVSCIHSIDAGLKKIAMETEKFSVAFDELAVFGSRYQPRVLWFATNQNQILKELNVKITNNLEKIGIRKQTGNYVPHLSIARIRKLKNLQFFQKLLDAFKSGSSHEQNIDKLILFESVLHSKGAEYYVISEYSLGSNFSKNEKK